MLQSEIKQNYKNYQIIRKTTHHTLRNDFFELCIEYSKKRAEWTLMEKDRRLEMDEPRTATHNGLISAANALARNMRASGESAQWRDDLGDNRKHVGDFACYIAFFLALDGA